VRINFIRQYLRNERLMAGCEWRGAYRNAVLLRDRKRAGEIEKALGDLPPLAGFRRSLAPLHSPLTRNLLVGTLLRPESYPDAIPRKSCQRYKRQDQPGTQ
jgi:hypothetical protein